MEWSVIQKEKNIDGELIYRLLAWSQFDNGDLVSKFGPVLKNFKGQGRIQALSHYFDTDYISRIDIKVKPSCWDINDIRKLYYLFNSLSFLTCSINSSSSIFFMFLYSSSPFLSTLIDKSYNK